MGARAGGTARLRMRGSFIRIGPCYAQVDAQASHACSPRPGRKHNVRMANVEAGNTAVSAQHPPYAEMPVTQKPIVQNWVDKEQSLATPGKIHETGRRRVDRRGMNIGLFGGSFDPIHRGHLALVHAATERFSLRQVLFVPANVPPHKQKHPVTAFVHRFAMVALATQDDKRWVPALL